MPLRYHFQTLFIIDFHPHFISKHARQSECLVASLFDRSLTHRHTHQTLLKKDISFTCRPFSSQYRSETFESEAQNKNCFIKVSTPKKWYVQKEPKISLLSISLVFTGLTHHQMKSIKEKRLLDTTISINTIRKWF